MGFCTHMDGMDGGYISKEIYQQTSIHIGNWRKDGNYIPTRNEFCSDALRFCLMKKKNVERELEYTMFSPVQS